MNGAALTLYYDGKCAFCASEMARLGRWDRAGKLAFVDIAQAGFDPAYLKLSMAELNRQMVSQTGAGRVLVGIDSMVAAYTLVGRGILVWPLRVPLLRSVLSLLYRLFARNRYTLSRMLGYKAPACPDGVCGIGNPFMKNKDQ